MKYKVKIYASDNCVDTFFVDDWKVVRDGSWSEASYLLMIRRPKSTVWRDLLYICQGWGFKLFDENNELVYSMGQVDGDWIEPHVMRSGDSAVSVLESYIDEYADQPDAI